MNDKINDEFVAKLLERALTDDACDHGTSSCNFLNDFEEENDVSITDVSFRMLGGQNVMTVEVNENKNFNFKIDISAIE